jgi:hypothetical protein
MKDTSAVRTEIFAALFMARVVFFFLLHVFYDSLGETS